MPIQVPSTEPEVAMPMALPASPWPRQRIAVEAARSTGGRAGDVEQDGAAAAAIDGTHIGADQDPAAPSTGSRPSVSVVISATPMVAVSPGKAPMTMPTSEAPKARASVQGVMKCQIALPNRNQALEHQGSRTRNRRSNRKWMAPPMIRPWAQAKPMRRPRSGTLWRHDSRMMKAAMNRAAPPARTAGRAPAGRA